MPSPSTITTICPRMRFALLAALLGTSAPGWAAATAGTSAVSSAAFSRNPSVSARSAPPRNEGGLASLMCGSTTITQNADPMSIDIDGTVACTGQVPVYFSFENFVARVFTATSTFELGCVEFGIESNTGGASSVEVSLFGDSIVANPAAPLLAQVVVPVANNANQQLFQAMLPSAVLFPAGSLFSVQLRTPNRSPLAGGDGGEIFLGSNSNGQSAPAYIKAASCGVDSYMSFAEIGFPDVHPVMNLGVFQPLETEGVLICDDGTPMANCSVTLKYYDSTSVALSSATTTTDATGAFVAILSCTFSNSTNEHYVISTPCCTQSWVVPSTQCFGDVGTLTCDCTCDSTKVVTDSSFEVDPLLSYTAVLNNFVLHQGKWGAESGTIVTGAANGVTPYIGSKMLCMTTDGLVVTQAVQVIDVSSLATSIDASLLEAEVTARFNVGSSVPAAIAYPMLRFFSAASYGSQLSNLANMGTLDANPATWELRSVDKIIPVGARWIVVETGFNNASIGTEPGYVDDVSLCIRPVESVPSNCRVYWVRSGDPSGANITSAEYDGSNAVLFDPLATVNPSIAFHTVPAHSLYWKESGLLDWGAAYVTPATPAVVGAAPCPTDTSLITTSPLNIYVSCQSSNQIWRIPNTTGTGGVPALLPLTVGTIRAIAYHRVNNKLYVAMDGSSSAEIWIWDPSALSFTFFASIPQIVPGNGARVLSMDFDYSGDFLYLLCQYGNQLNPNQPSIERIDLSSGIAQNVLLNSPGGGTPVGRLPSAYHGMAVDGALGFMWWTCESANGNLPEVRRMPLGLGGTPTVIATGTPFEKFLGIAVSNCHGTCSGDLNGDSFVDGADLGAFLAEWGGDGAGDLNGDGIADGADLGVILAAWGECAS